MTARTQPTNSRRWVLLLLAAVVVAATILGAGSASAAAPGDAESRVRASAVAVEVPIEPPQGVSAGERLGNEPAEPWIVVATGVATNAGSRLLSPSSLADEVAQATGGAVKANKGGYTVNVPYGSRGITVRVMEYGGSRTNYYRVSVPGKETYTVTGQASMDVNLTHIDIGESSLDDILSIVARIQGVANG